MIPVCPDALAAAGGAGRACAGRDGAAGWEQNLAGAGEDGHQSPGLKKDHCWDPGDRW